MSGKNEKALKYTVTDLEGETWNEWLFKCEVEEYAKQGFTVDRIWFTLFG